MNHFAQVMRSYGDRYMTTAHPENDWMHLVGFVFCMLVIIAVLVMIWQFLNRRPTNGDSDPLAVAKLRLAKGEIDAAQFEEIKKALK